jgi:predicted homoserine dehydrogenase-like protein
LYRPYHLIGLELGISLASVCLRREATGCAQSFLGDVVSTAKRDLAAGEQLDGEGGYMVWGRLMPADASLSIGGLPIGLAHGVRLRNPVREGSPVRWSDVEIDEGREAVRVRRQMESER